MMLKWFKKLGAAARDGAKEPETDVLAELPPERLLSESEACKKRGNELLGQGLLEEAAVSYRQAIALHPGSAEAHLNLGFVLKELGRPEEAQRSLEQAAYLDPLQADAFYILGLLVQEQGKTEEAVRRFNQALTAKPDFEVAYRDLWQLYLNGGQQDLARQTAQRALAADKQLTGFHYYLGSLCASERLYDKAVAHFNAELALQPGYAEAHVNLGTSLQALGGLEEAVASYRKALALKPALAAAHVNLGTALQGMGRLEEALASYRRAIELQPALAEAHYNLGNIYKDLDQLEEAVECYRKALELSPGEAEVHVNLGIVLEKQGKLEASIESYRKAIALKPGYAEAYSNLGNALKEQGKLDAAVEAYRKAVELKPEFAEAYYNLGNGLQAQGRLEEAIKNYRLALSLNQDIAEVYCNLGHAIQAQGDLAAAIGAYRQALALKPDYFDAHNNLLFALSFDGSCDPAAYLAQARHYGEIVGRHATPYADWPAALSRTAGPLRIGMVSGDLRQHPVGFFLEAILTHLDPAQVELVAYSMTQKEDALTARLKPRFAAWNVIRGKDDATVARQIRDDGIQILIDLAGHTGDNRLPVFAWKAAPVQASWLGYWASTGVPGMDYLLADPVSVPESQRAQFTEQVWYLPDTRLCFTAPAAASHLMPTALPALEKGHVTFGSFQNLSKVNDAVLAAWGRIFAALPQARLRLQTKQMGSAEARLQLLERLGRVGIAPERVTLLGSVPREAYLAAHGEVDMILDTFPFPGGTTTCEALWMGVPTVTLAGDTLLSRQGASLQGCVGLSAWIAETQDEYVEKAVAHAQDLAGLARLRAGLRERVLASPLYEAPRFAAHWQQALQDMWSKENGL